MRFAAPAVPGAEPEKEANGMTEADMEKLPQAGAREAMRERRRAPLERIGAAAP